MATAAKSESKAIVYKSAYTKALRNSILDLRQKDITELPLGVFQLHEFVPDENGWWELVIPHTLLLTHNNIKNLSSPNDYKWSDAWKELQTFDAAYNLLTEIPMDILKLKFLKKLVIHHNNLTQISFISTNLVYIELQNNNLESLDENIGECTNLQYFNASYNKLLSLPVSLSKCINLQTFEATNNQISGNLNINFATCTKLKEFDVSKNKITSINSSLFYLPLLFRLSCTQNKINNIDVVMDDNEQKQDSHLIELYLGNNNLSTFPFDKLKLYSLKLLDLKCNNFSKIDKSISECCVKLQRLDISENNLMNLPSELSLIEDLKTIIVIGNPLRRMNRSVINDSYSLINYLRKRLMPKDMNNDFNNIQNAMNELDINNINCKELKLNKHNLLSLPKNVCKMAHLCHLELDNNKISNINDLKYCKNLEHISLMKNNIYDIQSLFELNKLQFIDLRANKLQNLDILVKDNSNLCLWPYIHTLRLSYNQITQLSKFLECIESNNIMILDIGNNKITAFPNCVLKWKLLQVLDLSNNDLSKIPFELGLLEKLNSLMLFGNNLRRMQSVINQGNTQKILQWLKNRIQ